MRQKGIEVGGDTPQGLQAGFAHNWYIRTELEARDLEYAVTRLARTAMGSQTQETAPEAAVLQGQSAKTYQRATEPPGDPTGKPPKHWGKAFDGLKKRTDYSEYMDVAKLTTRQRDCYSIRTEYRRSDGTSVPVKEVVERLGVHRKVVYDHLAKAEKKIDTASGISRSKHRMRLS